MRGYAVVDVETTGFHPAHGEITEIAIVHTDLKGNVTETWDTLVRPRGRMAGTNVHRITASMVRSAPSFGEIAHEVRVRLTGRVAVAHNLPFDARFLTAQLDRVELPAPQIAAGVCTLKLARRQLRGPLSSWSTAATSWASRCQARTPRWRTPSRRRACSSTSSPGRAPLQEKPSPLSPHPPRATRSVSSLGPPEPDQTGAAPTGSEVARGRGAARPGCFRAGAVVRPAVSRARRRTCRAVGAAWRTS